MSKGMRKGLRKETWERMQKERIDERERKERKETREANCYTAAAAATAPRCATAAPATRRLLVVARAVHDSCEKKIEEECVAAAEEMCVSRSFARSRRSDPLSQLCEARWMPETNETKMMLRR